MYIDNDGQKWYKGNLHTHTTQSDGKLTPEETQKLHRDNGYDFIAITDHWKPTETGNDHDILRITGCEYHTGENVIEGIYHIVGIGMTKPVTTNINSLSPAQDLIDAVNNAGGIAVLAHPVWSMNDTSEIKKLTGLSGVEIFNSVSDIPWNLRGHSGVIIDRLAAEGYILPCIAADDTHFYTADQCRSYIWVKADELTETAIVNSIKNGDLIASQGPFFSVKRIDDKLIVDCTPVTTAAFLSNMVWTSGRMTYGENITHAEYTIKDKDTFVRVELIDKNGNRAWSTPIVI
ncbi:MAG: CehA/McbA family metallohydrolase [Oscillospiraceae bacterium]|nr:CehA/McbA family metallohydrolase [Oscillospiraceae bacterium]